MQTLKRLTILQCVNHSSDFLWVLICPPGEMFAKVQMTMVRELDLPQTSCYFIDFNTNMYFNEFCQRTFT